MESVAPGLGWRNILKKLLWPLVAVALAVLTACTVFSKSGLTFGELWQNVREAEPLWLVPAVLSMLCFIGLEGEALRQIARTLGYPVTVRRGFLYASADIYFSSITPSASGGQPASAYFMYKDGMRGPAVSVALILNLTMYTLALVTIGVATLLCFPGIFLRFNLPCKALVVFGIAIMLVLAVLFLMLLRGQRILFALGNALAALLFRLRFRSPAARLRHRLADTVQKYNACVETLAGQKLLLVKVYVLNLLQRLAQVLVTVFSYYALRGDLRTGPGVFAVQSYVMLGSNFIPVPGAIGISEYIMLSGYRMFMDGEAAYNLACVSRGISFYTCSILSAVTVLLGYLFLRGRGKKEGGAE